MVQGILENTGGLTFSTAEIIWQSAENTKTNHAEYYDLKGSALQKSTHKKKRSFIVGEKA